MLTIIFTEFKNMWFGKSKTNDNFDEIDRLESKHTRVRFDKDIYEIIASNSLRSLRKTEGFFNLNIYPFSTNALVS